MAEQKISEKIVAELPAPQSGNKLHYFSGATLQGKKAPSGFAVRVTAAGTKSFVWFHRVNGRPYLETIGRWHESGGGGSMKVLAAINKAKRRAAEVADRSADPRPERTRRDEDGDKPAGETVGSVLDAYVAYTERAGKLRSIGAIKSAFDRLVKPRIGATGIYDIRRSHVAAMLDRIEHERGPTMADRTLSCLTAAFNWQMNRDDDFQTPIKRGMNRTKPRERARSRILADDELRDLWAALDRMTGHARYPSFIRFVLYTASRRNEAGRMSWAELDDDIWTIPGARYKTKHDHEVPLSGAAQEQLGPMPDDPAAFVFPGIRGSVAFNSHGRAKIALDKQIAEVRRAAGRKPIEPWTLHDLRRTARTLMSRAGVEADHAERAIGHAIGGIRGVYDHHKYLEEKRQAFDALAGQIDRILHPADNVINVGDRKRGRA
jgi:integrase